ncbi:MAG: type IV pilus twitching motility protein PilT [Planctomycetes bacterium]|nr:type IV pilus twitching motility protein PilT [Planctomycetota bacterium]
MVTLEELLHVLMERKGSDLHVTAGSPPRIRTDGALIPLDMERLTAEETQKIIYSILDNDQIAKFEREKELDMSFGIAGIGRFRVNVFFQRGAVGTAIRVIPYNIMKFEDLGLPRTVCEKLCSLPKGLILVTGATGSGKSTSLASMINHINETRQEHIITIEDPIEFVHRNKKCLLNQREVGPDTHNFAAALKHVLRQDPDIVLIGEMRDMETIELGLTLAETGHLTFATLHTSDCTQTINRVIDVFPSSQQSQVRTQLSFVLEGVFCQQLLKLASGRGRCLSCEIMLPTPGIRANVRDDKIHQLYSAIQTGGKEGMMTMNMSLFNLYMQGKITREAAFEHSTRPEELEDMFQQAAREAEKRR